MRSRSRAWYQLHRTDLCYLSIKLWNRLPDIDICSCVDRIHPPAKECLVKSIVIDSSKTEFSIPGVAKFASTAILSYTENLRLQHQLARDCGINVSCSFLVFLGMAVGKQLSFASTQPTRQSSHCVCIGCVCFGVVFLFVALQLLARNGLDRDIEKRQEAIRKLVEWNRV